MSIVLNPFLSTDFFADEDWPYNMLGTARADRGQDVGGGTRQRGDRKQGVWRPRMDWFEQEDAYVITLELAGLTKDQVDLSLHDNVLTVSGSTSTLEQCKHDPGKCAHFSSERRFGPFQRQIAVPNGLKENEIKASMQHGLLRLEFPKQAKESEVKKITIG